MNEANYIFDNIHSSSQHFDVASPSFASCHDRIDDESDGEIDLRLEDVISVVRMQAGKVNNRSIYTAKAHYIFEAGSFTTSTQAHLLVVDYTIMVQSPDKSQKVTLDRSKAHHTKPHVTTTCSLRWTRWQKDTTSSNVLFKKHSLVHDWADFK